MDGPIEGVIATIGPRLRKMRIRRYITLEGLADQTGITASALSLLETGKRKPTLTLLILIAESYQVTLDEIVFG